MHCVTFTNVCATDGTVIWFSTAGGSILPYHGDTALTGRTLFQDVKDEETGAVMDEGLVKIIRGSKKYFVIVVAGE